MAGRTYRYMTEEPQFPFGFGLSYSQFAYSAIQAPAAAQSGDGLPVSVTVTNTGSREADEVVQLYLAADQPAAGDPLYTLVGFSRISLAPGAAQTVHFTLAQAQLATVDDTGHAAIRPGVYRLIAGGSSPGARSSALGAPAPAELKITLK
jgi:beta-glucosidase